MLRKLVVAGIGTEVGKTVIASVLVEALDADYWKPVQAGSLHETDTDVVRSLAPGRGRSFHPEAYRLRGAISPHAAAESEGVCIDADAFSLPPTDRSLVIELAGGLMVPLAKGLLNIDVLNQWALPVVLVVTDYLGSINHTLLSVHALRRRSIPVCGIVFNGDPTPSSRSVILSETGLPCLLQMDRQDTLTPAVITHYAGRIQL